jgi:Ca2+/Na+ antiporter
MNKIVKISLLVILCLAMFYSSMICCIFNHTILLDSDGCVVPMSEEETEMYNLCLFILILGSLVLAKVYLLNQLSNNQS